MNRIAGTESLDHSVHLMRLFGLFCMTLWQASSTITQVKVPIFGVAEALCGLVHGIIMEPDAAEHSCRSTQIFAYHAQGMVCCCALKPDT